MFNKKEFFTIGLFALLAVAASMGILALWMFGSEKWLFLYREVPLWGVDGLAEFLDGVGLMIVICFSILVMLFIISLARLRLPTDHFIYSRPMRVDTKDVVPGDTSGLYFSRADGKFLIVLDKKLNKSMYWSFGLGLLFMVSVFLFELIKGKLDMTSGLFLP